jgi:hypothetical protein
MQITIQNTVSLSTMCEYSEWGHNEARSLLLDGMNLSEGERGGTSCSLRERGVGLALDPQIK